MNQEAKLCNHNAASWIQRHAEAAGDRPAIADDCRQLDYAALEDRIGRLAGWLAAAGTKPGDRVGLLLCNTAAYLECLFAIARIGAIALPINTRLTPVEVAFLLDDSRPLALIHSDDLTTLATEACAAAAATPRVRLQVSLSGAAAGVGVADFEQAIASTVVPAPIQPVEPDTPMILMYTSGTTGQPKGALLPHRKALYNSRNAEIYFEANRDDRVLIVAPLFHSLGLQILALPALYVGASLVIQRRFEPEAVWRAVADRAITYLGGVPNMYRRLLDVLPSVGSTNATDSLRFLFTAGAAAPAELVRAYADRGLLLMQGYGQTESSTLTCLAPADVLTQAGSVGMPVEHAELRVVAREWIDGPVDGWRDVPPGEPGEVVVRGPIVMLRYWERPEATAETLPEGWLRTGDLATRDEEGFITLVGRSREMFISGGENVYPAEIEARYAEHPAIAEIAVVGVPDSRWGETGRAHVVLHGGSDADEAELLAWGGERLARFKLPARFVFESELPKTASGKVQKHRLTEPATDRSTEPRS